MAVYACSDLHGCMKFYKEIKKMLQPEDKVFFLGDAGDRGPEPWETIQAIAKDRQFVYLKGNHEDMLAEALVDFVEKDYMGSAYRCLCGNGGYETFDAVIADEKSEIYLMQLARTKLYHCYENTEGKKIHLSHAGFSLMADDEIPNDEDLLWDRDHIDDHCDWWPEENPNDYVVHGHTGCVSSVFKRSSFAFGDIDFNKSRTLCRYAHGHKICIDGRAFLTQTIARLDLDTLEEKVFFDSDAFPTE